MTSRDRPDKIVVVSAEMIRAGMAALREETFGSSHGELVSLIYMAMEYQRRRDAASSSEDSR
jgi:hypothetical protein